MILPMRKLLILAAALVSAAALGYAQELQQIPNDPAVRVGRLDNGMTYYIRHNDKPAQRAEFYLATHVGALQESPEQDGLAHFLEHMCFNGTQNFPGKGILNWLESIGASFGGNVNASTGVEQTIYLLNNIPLVRPTVVDTCLLIMHDYSHFVTNDPAEIDKERGVILEEKRSRNTAAWRIREASGPYLYGDTKYATTSVIGSEENLRNFKPETLVDFYRSWYRPDLQALVVVGDIDPDYVEAAIRRTFADIPAPVNPRPKTRIAIPDNEEPAIAILTDPELNNTSVSTYWRSEARPTELNSTLTGMIIDLFEEVLGQAMLERFTDMAAQADAPFLDGGVASGSLCESAEVVLSQVACRDGEALGAFAAGLLEVEKVRRFGLTDAEIDRAVSEILSQYEAAAARADTRSNSEFVMPLIYHFFENRAYPEPQLEYELAQQIFAQLPHEAINQYVSQLFTRENLVVIYQAPEREGLAHPDAGQFRAVIDAVEHAELSQADAEEIPADFLDPASLPGGRVVSSAPGLYDSQVHTLSNGLKLILLPTDHERDRIQLTLWQEGGRSLLSDAELPSFESNIWGLYLQNSGISSFPATTVRKMLAGKQLAVEPYIENYTHGINAQTTVKELETVLQLMYLYYTDPRFDEAEYAQGRSQIEAVLPNLMTQSNYKLNDAINRYVYDNPRRFTISPEVLEKASLETLGRVFRRLFHDAAGATLVVVGDFESEEILPLLCRYAGSLPAGGTPTRASYRGDGITTANVTHDFRAQMATPQVTVLQAYNRLAPYSVEADAAMDALSYILDMIYTETLREDEGGTYSASSSPSVSNKPDERRMLQVVFQTNVDSADKLRELARAGLRSLAEEGPGAEQFDKAVMNLRKTQPESRQHNSYWSTMLQLHERFGMDYDQAYEAAVEGLTPQKVRDAARELLEGNSIEIIMRPEE